MEFPGQLVIGGNRFQGQELHHGLLYTPLGLSMPYVFIPDRTVPELDEWLVQGIFRARLSHVHEPAEFQRGEAHPYVAIDHMVKSAAADMETASFARMFWTEITRRRR